MKILQVAPPWIKIPPEGYGGTEWVIRNLVEGLSALGHKVNLFATKDSNVSTKLDFVFEKALSEMGVPWTSALPSLLHYHKAFKKAPDFDIVHAHLSSGTDMITIPFLSDLADQGIPAVVTVHGHFPYDRYSYMDNYYFKHFWKKVTAINISHSMEKVLPGSFKNGGVAYNSLDTNTLKFNKVGGKYLTWLGKILPDKGTHEAIMTAIASGEQLVFAGIVDTFQDISARYFEEKIKPLIDGTQIKYLGPADLKLKNKMLGGAKGFLNPINWEEPFGMVMVESMACGTPVISYNRGAAPELIKNGKTGFLVSGLKEMIQVIPKLNKIDRKNCRTHIEEYFSPQSAAKKHLEIYKQVITDTKKINQFLIKSIPNFPIS